MGQPSTQATDKPVETLETVVIRFAGDSGDGMQLTGTQFTNESAAAGNDIATLPDFPAEIRAPAGTLAGVSGFQLNFSSQSVLTPGDQPDVLVAMNPAALRVNLGDLRKNGILILDTDAFSTSNLRKAGYAEHPASIGDLDGYQVFDLPMAKLTAKALENKGLPNKTVVRCRNFFALGLCAWMFGRPTEGTLKWISEKFAKSEALIDANTTVFKAGWNYGETTETFTVSYQVAAADIAPGVYTSVTGNRALALGLITAAAKAELPLFYGSYPITPATDILHELADAKAYGVTTFQAEDEIAAIGASIGASFGGALGVTASSGPGIALKGEAIGLATMVELPLIILNVQRGGPSTGLPTKTEQADLMQALYGRNGECPVAVIAPQTPVDCFTAVLDAVRATIRHMVPVMVLSDGYLANGAEPWLLPRFEDIESIPQKFWTETLGFQPYLRDEDTLARPWVRPGTPGLEHRVGGIEKDYGSGDISYDPDNHERMVRVRASKVERIADTFPATEVFGSELGEAVIVGWGSTFGAIRESVERLNAEGMSVGHVHLRWLNPLPSDLEKVLRRFKTVIVPEMNLGQLVRVLRDRFVIDAVPVSQVTGQPFRTVDLVERLRAILEERR